MMKLDSDLFVCSFYLFQRCAKIASCVNCKALLEIMIFRFWIKTFKTKIISILVSIYVPSQLIDYQSLKHRNNFASQKNVFTKKKFNSYFTTLRI